ncbi:YtxH domain-containing protein [Flavobacterium psychrotolerans]|uniref:YtxH domain-containing protein n=1 Tax=Flavobacterium psychrotolerans TaxID=2169410 RepID=A0A2U1JIS8_9FLAO|nr:YtxH domain-containing protein [Flavobacterium psychrotolerans]PWA04788.1 hypothetical protein DB895_09895 [Flavobacterium psychrotolerans]
MDTGKVVLGALAGLATGAILGILFAPDKGTNTRKKIADKGRDASDSLVDKYNEVINSLSSKLEKAKNEGLNYFEDGEELVKNAKSNISNHLK